MALKDEIDRFIAYFRDRLSEISSIDKPLYSKTLYVTLLDCLSRAAFPKVSKNRARFIGLIDKISGWTDKDRVSTPQLLLELEKAGIDSGPLYEEAYSCIIKWVPGYIIRAVGDPLLDDLARYISTQDQQLIKNARYAELLYAYRNSLVHEFREPGYGFEFSDDPSTPYYHSHSEINTNMRSWELVFPKEFFHMLCEQSVIGLEGYLIVNNVNPYSSYRFGSKWVNR